jgi:bifunctional non-homologous end joining protein LigD
MSLAKYRQKRTFNKTPEPTGGKSDNQQLHFVIQKHDASHLHYDFRLEVNGVLKSWAVPKGPSMDPSVKRLAMMVEDHPYDYKDFEGVIPAGNYGAGTVIVWDEGTYVPVDGEGNKKAVEKDVLKRIDSGKLHFILDGEKLKGEFALVKVHGRGENGWLLMKIKDKNARTADVTKMEKSVLSGRTLKQVEKDPERTWGSKAKAAVQKDPEGDLSALLAKGKKAAMPKDIKPMLATLTEKPFDKADWLYEIKWDGYRAVSYVNKKKVAIYSRNLLSFNEKFDVVVDALKEWDAKAVVDGEIVALDDEGNPDFQALQNYLKTGKSVRLVYYVFDLIWYDGKDLTDLPLVERKEILRQVLPEGNDMIRYSEHITGEKKQGSAFFKAALSKGLEGIMAKDGDSAYVIGRRSESWLKVKNNLRTEAIICGYTAGRNSRKHFGAVVLGKYKNGVLQYIGHTGGGFDTKSLKELYEKMQPLITDKPPFKVKPKTNMPATWLKPELVCEVKFAEETNEGILRQPIFLGLREDKHAVNEKKEKVVKAPVSDKGSKAGGKVLAAKKVIDEVTGGKGDIVKGGKEVGESAGKETQSKTAGKEAVHAKSAGKETQLKMAGKKAGDAKSAGKRATPKKAAASKVIGSGFIPDDQKEAEIKINGKLLKFTNLDKLYWPDESITKRDMLNYYAAVADTLLPYLKDRPQSLNRFPDGIKGFHFYQKNVEDKVADWVEKFPYVSESDGETKEFLVCKDKASLLYMANLGCIELNPWHSRTSKPDNPDYCLIDLDPDTNDYNEVIKTALEIKKLLDDVGADSFVKTSGSTGMHILIPLGAKYTFDQSRMLAELIVGIINKRLPDITSIERSPAKRKGKIYLDFLQNRQIQTMAAAYSLRPKPGATVSAPLKWSEVKKGLSIQNFDIYNMIDRIKKEGDLLKGVLGKGINMQQVLKKIQKYM